MQSGNQLYRRRQWRFVLLVRSVWALERPGFGAEARSPSLLAKLAGLAGMLDRNEIAALPGNIRSNAKAAWPPLAMFKALLLSIWFELFRCEAGRGA